MPTGPFKKLGAWDVRESDGSRPTSGPSAKITVVRATSGWIKYTRKCARLDPKGERVRHAKVLRWGPGVYRVSLGGFQYAQAERA